MAKPPTPAQRRALLDAIEHDGQLDDKIGSTVCRTNTLGTLIERGWVMRSNGDQPRMIIEAGRKAVDQ